MDEELIPKSLADKGRSLDEELGISEIAWPREVAFDLIASLREAGAVILGGDVYIDRDGTLASAYSNWACDRLPGESTEEHAARSAEKATQYIKDYSPPLDGALYFVLVASADPTAGL